jgi:hypothetical protein
MRERSSRAASRVRYRATPLFLIAQSSQQGRCAELIQTRQRISAATSGSFNKHFFSLAGEQREYHLKRTGSANASPVQ